MKSKSFLRTVSMCRAATIASAYVVLTYIMMLFGLDSGVIQLRISEALCVLPLFTSAAIPGLFAGCFLANLLTGAVVLDLIIGPIATLIGALGTYLLRKHPILALLVPVLANAVMIPFVLAYGYGMEQAIPLLMASVCIGEVISIYGVGLLFYFGVKPHSRALFGEIK